ncbi:hypothetical protein CVT26_005694 [Gymnopilus dilepis]|uniref:F-box domain-containing protein n=1 Tax=Gymnopilus dilepis TaxID=231916 RepID=A0A409W7Y3_9AGAR|nr:hypothetical protein CVT26_005694 [Gymnopilus dilepis]
MVVSQLPTEILLEIFFLNTNIFVDYNCLQTTISCTQVCSIWRTLLLSMPSLWAHLLHLDKLQTISNSARREILARSRNDNLWVVGVVHDSGILGGDKILPFFVDAILFSNQWVRIEHLHISIDAPSKKLFWPLFQRRAPNMRSLTFHALFEISSDDDKPLFLNHAPSLRQFSSNCIPFNLTSCWIGQLRQLSLCMPFTAYKVLLGLQLTPLLEELTISGLLLDFTVLRNKLPHVSLSHLKILSLQDLDIHDCISFLEHIHPAYGCAINFKPDAMHDAGQFREGLDQILSALSTRLSQYLRLHHPRIHKAEVQLSSGTFLLECSPRQQVDTGKFKVSIRPLRGSSGPADFDQLAVSMISDLDWAVIKTLHLTLSSMSPWSIHPYATLCDLFSSITHLVVGEETLGHILNIPTCTNLDLPDSVPFPQLDTLTITTLEDEIMGSIRPLLRFLHFRLERRCPIQKLIYYASSYQANLRGLEHLKGLQVVRRGLEGEVEYNF